MAEKKRKKPYYGKKGGTAVYKDEMRFDIFSTMRALSDFYEGRAEESPLRSRSE